MLSHSFRYLIVVFISFFLLSACQPASTPEPKVVTIIYDDITATGWQDWSWDTANNIYSTAKIHSGTQAIETRFKAFGGFSLRSEVPIDPIQYTHITFWAMAPDGEQNLFVFTQGTDDGEESAKVTVTVGTKWQEFAVALTDLESPSVIKRINIQEATGTPVSVVYIDDLILIGK